MAYLRCRFTGNLSVEQAETLNFNETGTYTPFPGSSNAKLLKITDLLFDPEDGSTPFTFHGVGYGTCHGVAFLSSAVDETNADAVADSNSSTVTDILLPKEASTVADPISFVTSPSHPVYKVKTTGGGCEYTLYSNFNSVSGSLRFYDDHTLQITLSNYNNGLSAYYRLGYTFISTGHTDEGGNRYYSGMILGGKLASVNPNVLTQSNIDQMWSTPPTILNNFYFKTNSSNYGITNLIYSTEDGEFTYSNGTTVGTYYADGRYNRIELELLELFAGSVNGGDVVWDSNSTNVNSIQTNNVINDGVYLIRSKVNVILKGRSSASSSTLTTIPQETYLADNYFILHVDNGNLTLDVYGPEENANSLTENYPGGIYTASEKKITFDDEYENRYYHKDDFVLVKTIDLGTAELERVADTSILSYFLYRQTTPTSQTPSQTQLYVSGTTATKVYNGDATASNSQITCGTIVDGSGNTVNVSLNPVVDTNTNQGHYRNSSNTADQINVGECKLPVSYEFVNSGDADDYILPASELVSATITPLQIVMSDGGSPSDKIYDGTSNASVTINKRFVFGFGDDSDYLDVYPSGTFVDANNNAVSSVGDHDVYCTYSVGYASGYSSSNTSALPSNYTPPAPRLLEDSATISKRQLTVSGTVASNKTYDGNSTASISEVNKGTLGNVVSGDVVSISSVTGLFDDKNVGTSKTVTLTYTITGASATNYNSPTSATTTANITEKQLSVTGTTIYDKAEYDGSVDAVVNETGSLSGVISGDDVDFSVVSASFDSKDVAISNGVVQSKSVQVTYSLSGDDASNYSVSSSTCSATIYPRLVSISVLG